MGNFLFSRGIEFKVGEKYPKEYAEIYKVKYGIYDIHFKGKINEYKNKWIDCEIWGENPNGHSKELYAIKRKNKELFNFDNNNFLGIEYHICYNEDKLIELLEKYIGIIEPFNFINEDDKKFKPTQWNLKDDVINQCKYIMDNNNGIIPTEEWLRKRGKYKNRETFEWENKYNLGSLTVYIKEIGGMRKVRELLNNSEKSTIKWDKNKIINLFIEIYNKYDKTPQGLLYYLKNKNEKSNDEINLTNTMISVISSCSNHFNGKYREACILSNIPVRKL